MTMLAACSFRAAAHVPRASAASRHFAVHLHAFMTHSSYRVQYAAPRSPRTHHTASIDDALTSVMSHCVLTVDGAVLLAN